jgi:tripartite-type tricarboxylate transporter receptor subunit TctC
VLAQPDTQKRIADQGFQLFVMPPEKAAAYMRAERARWAKAVKDLGIAQQ